MIKINNCNHDFILITNKEDIKIWWAFVFFKKQEQHLLCKHCGVKKR